MCGLKVAPELNCLHSPPFNESPLCQPAPSKSLKLTSQNKSTLLSDSERHHTDDKDPHANDKAEVKKAATLD